MRWHLAAATFYLLLLCQAVSVTSQILSAAFTPCLQSSAQAPSNQLLNISKVYAQLDTGKAHGSSGNSQDNTDGQTLLRLVALADTGSQSEGFSNVTNYLATLIVETSILSFEPYSNQSSLCSSIITAGDSLVSDNNNISASNYPSPGGCPYGPGPVLIGYDIALGSIGLNDYYPLSTLSTRMRILDTSVPPLQLACVDVYTTPYYDNTEAAVPNDASSLIYVLIMWLPIATVIGYLAVNLLARLYASWSTVKYDREAALAASLRTKLSSQSIFSKLRDVALETTVGRSIIRSRSLTRFVTPGVGDVLGTFQWIAMVGMCSVLWQGFAYPIFARLGWSMLIFNTTLVTPSSHQTDPSYSSDRYPPVSFQFNSKALFTSPSSPFYFSTLQKQSNLLNIPSTGLYNSTLATDASIYPSENEVNGLASFSAVLGFRPQDLFANSLTFFAILLAATVLFTLVIPVLTICAMRLLGRNKGYTAPSHTGEARHSHSTFGEDNDLTAIQLARSRFHSLTGGSFSKGSRGSAAEDSMDRTMSRSSGKFGSAATGMVENGGDYANTLGTQNRQQQQHNHGIHRWWAGGGGGDRERHQADDENEDAASSSHFGQPNSRAHHSPSFWSSFCIGSIARLVMLFHLPICIFSVYQMAHASSSSTIQVVFAAIVFFVFAVAVPLFLVMRIRRTMTRYLQDDTNTLLKYGPVYNTYAQDSYTFSAVRFTANLVEGCIVGGAQNRATVQAAVILAVEIIETIVTSIWLPWGEGASQGPLQFILSVSRIITAVLLIVISPAVRMSFTARGWIGYVILLLQAMVAVLLLLVLLSKTVELAFRILAKVEFDESRSSKDGGLFGALRKKGVLGFKRRKSERRNRRGKGHAVNSSTPAPARPSYGRQPTGNSVSNASPQYSLPGRYLKEDDEDDAYIMSAFQTRPHQNAGYVPPGSYAAPPGHQNQPASSSGFQMVRGGRATAESPYSLAGTSHRNALPPGAAPAASTADLGIIPLGSPSSSNRQGPRRERAASHSAIVEYFAQDGEISPAATSHHSRQTQFQQTPASEAKESRRLSAPVPMSPGFASRPSYNQARRPNSMAEPSTAAMPPNWRRESTTGSGFFNILFKGNSRQSQVEEEPWTDSDDSDDEAASKNKRRWPFTKAKPRKSGNGREGRVDEQDDETEALDEEAAAWAAAEAEDEQEDGGDSAPTTGKSFVVVRKPMK